MDKKKTIVENMIVNARTHLLDTSFNNRMINSKITLNKGLSFSVENLDSFYQMVIKNHPFSFLPLENKKKDKSISAKNLRLEANKNIEKVGSTNTVCILDSTQKPSLISTKFSLDEGDSKLVYNNDKERDNIPLVEEIYSHIKKHFTKYGILQDNIYNKNIIFNGFKKNLKEDISCSKLSLYLSIVSLLRNEGIPKDYMFLGDFNAKYELAAVKNIVEKLEFAVEKGFKTIFIPKRNKKDIKNLPLNVLNSLELIYISNIDEAILAEFEMINTVDESNGDGEFIISKNSTPQKIFYVNYNNEDLKTRTEKIYTNSKRHIEEQGINILFLSLGFVQWKNTINNDDEIINSPLVFIPVTIEASNYKNVYKLSYSNSEILLNKSLAKKLEIEYNIDFSNFPLEIADESEFNVVEYLEQFYDIMKESGHDFGIDYHSVHLSFYSYNKFLMYNDLDPQNWETAFDGTDDNVLSDIFLNNIYHEVSNIDDDKNIDNSNEIDTIKNVVDADSSQLLAISKVNRGNSIIIQGPPGTGKSQTIVNIIAESIRQNKKVLFMSEKLAAMDVVYNRLKAINLNHIALQLHSDKVNKSQVVKEIQSIYYMNKLNVKNQDPDIFNKLSNLRKEINKYYELLGKNALHSKTNLIDTYKNIIELENHFDQYEVKHYELEIPNNFLMSLNDYEYGQLENELDSLENFYNKYGDLSENVLNSLSLSRTLTHHELIRYQNTIDLILDVLKKTTKNISYPKINSLKGGVVTMSEIEALLEIKKLDPTVLDYVKSIKHSLMLEKRVYLDELISHYKETLHSNAHINKDLLNSSEFIDELTKLLEEIKLEITYFANNKSFFKQSKKAYKEHKDITLNKYFIVEDIKQEDIIEGLKWLYSNIYFKLEITKEAPLLEKIFGPKYKKEEDFSTIVTVYESINQVYQSIKQLFTGREENHDLYLDFFKKFITKDFDINHLDKLLSQIEANLLIDVDTLFGKASHKDVSLISLTNELTKMRELLPNFNDITMMKSVKRKLETQLNDEYLLSLIKDENYGNHISKVFGYIRHHSIVKEILEQNKELDNFNAMIFDQKVREFIYLDTKNIQMNHLQDTLDAHFYNVYNIRKDETLSVDKKDQKISYLLQTFNKKHNIPTVKQLLKNAFDPITELKPVFMMSPISISQYLDPIVGMFDVVVFDEASQIKPQDAFGALLRGKQVVVVGDEKQLPPTNFFESFYGSTELFSEDAISNYESILTLLRGSGVPTTTLNWHYRSKHHNLITISNEHFYEDSLRIFPSKYKNSPDFGLKYEFVNGTFDRGRSRTNLIEAKKVAEAVIKHAKSFPKLSLGVATLNINQRDLILSEIKKLRKNDESVADFFTEDKIEPFFVKNLENVQGDEREVIFVSVGYAKDKNGNIIQNFGAINHLGGERRLNVLMTRARQKCVLFTGLKASDLEVDYNTTEGVKVLRKFLKFAEINNEHEVETVSSETKIFAIEIAEELHKHGYEVAYNIGNSQYFIDLAIVNPIAPTEYILGIEFDNSSYQQSRTASERERIRNNVMRAKGWMIYKVYITSWFNNRHQMIDNILNFLKEIEKSKPIVEDVDIEFYEEPVNVVTRFGFEPYQMFTKRIENIQFMMKEFKDFEEYVKDMVYTESPVKFNVLLQRVLDNSHIDVKPSYVKKKLKKALRRLENDHIIYENNSFYYYYKKEDSIKFRDRRNFNVEINVQNVSDEEFIHAITEIARNSFGIDTSNITSIISNYLGYSNNNEVIKEIVERLSIRLVNNNVLFKDNNNNLQKNK